jgi:phage gp46-like protein
MDLALTYNAEIGALDLSLAGVDLRREDSLATAVMLSLLCDRACEANQVPADADRRGWWADAFADEGAGRGDSFGSRLWLIEREKLLPETLQRARRYAREALQWLIEDGLATGLEVNAFVPRAGWLVLDVVLHLKEGSRRYRFEWNDAAQRWRLADERFGGVH